MRFHWIKDRIKQGQFVIYWSPGITNPSNYVTKHHPSSHHIEIRKDFFVTHNLENTVILQLLQGCDICPKMRAARAQIMQTKHQLFNHFNRHASKASCSNANCKRDSNLHTYGTSTNCQPRADTNQDVDK